MDGENGRRLNTNGNVPDDHGEKLTPPFSVVNSDRSSISIRTEGRSNGEGNGSSSARTSVSLHNVPLPHDVPKRVEVSYRLDKSINGSPESFRRSSDVARDSFVLTESPAIQVMERPKTSNPSRAPSSNSATTESESPNRWSVDSNDSLFSIRVGNDSFSKDQSLRISVADMHGIGELSLSEAYLPRVSHSSEPSISPSAKATVDEALKDVREGAKPAVDEPNRDPPEASISIHTDSNLSQHSDPRTSNDYNKSHNQSSESPSTSASACPMCQSWCCYKMDWWCKWPSFCCRWPSCSCCNCNCNWFRWLKCCNICSSCPSCCSKCYGSCCCFTWKREPKRVRSVSSYALMDRNMASSSKHKV